MAPEDHYTVGLSSLFLCFFDGICSGPLLTTAPEVVPVAILVGFPPASPATISSLIKSLNVFITPPFRYLYNEDSFITICISHFISVFMIQRNNPGNTIISDNMDCFLVLRHDFIFFKNLEDRNLRARTHCTHIVPFF
ncbi:hypothetical protein CJ20_018 [Escherichia phage CJ20]|nr:hypothetical protein CJ20_018 [Escherichia phage CJ20]